MSKNKNPRPSGGTDEQGKDDVWADDSYNHDFTSGGANCQAGGHIWQLLPEGEALAIPANDFAKLAGYGSTRSLRAAVDGLRSNGVPVLASEHGYFKPIPGPAGITEIKRFLRRQDARAASNRATTRLIRARLREIERGPLPGQVDFWGGDDT